MARETRLDNQKEKLGNMLMKRSIKFSAFESTDDEHLKIINLWNERYKISNKLFLARGDTFDYKIICNKHEIIENDLTIINEQIRNCKDYIISVLCFEGMERHPSIIFNIENNHQLNIDLFMEFMKHSIFVFIMFKKSDFAVVITHTPHIALIK